LKETPPRGWFPMIKLFSFFFKKHLIIENLKENGDYNLIIFF
jgi:hypothetical protein